MKWWQKVSFTIFGYIARISTTLLFSTCRIEIIGKDIEDTYFAGNPGKGLLYAAWHRGLIYLIYYFRNLEFVVMASASKDGELAAQATKRHGWIPVRGSSTRRGSEALREMIPYIEKGHRSGLTVDAPQGPPYVSKIGIIVLAKRSGVPILPVMWGASRYWQLKSWDQTMIPKPFSRIVFLYSDALMHIPSDASREDCEAYRQELDDVLNRLMVRADSHYQPKVKK